MDDPHAVPPDPGAPDQSRDPPEQSGATAADPSGQDKATRWHRRLAFIAGGVVLAAVVIAGGLWWFHARQFVTTSDAHIDGYITKLAAQVPGRVTRLMFKDNQHVTAGQTLLLLDPRHYRVKLDEALARQASAKARVAQSDAQRVVEQAKLSQAHANLQSATAQMQKAQQDYDRYKTLGPHAVTRQQIDDATAALQSAQAQERAAHQGVNAAQAQVKAAAAQVIAAKAAVQQAQADVAAARLQLSYCTVTAPVSGTIGHRTVAVGDYINAGQPLFAIVQDKLWVTADFKETQLSALRSGQKVNIHVDAVPGVTFHGRVNSFQPGTGSVFSVLPAENATGNWVKVVQRLPVKIVFDDKRVHKYRLAPGMSVEPSVRVR